MSPTFAKRQVKSIKPSQIQAWISSLSSSFETSTVQTAFLVLQGVLDLAVADEAIKRHIAAYPPLTCSLPWEGVDGKPRTHNLLFRWTDDSFIKARSYSETVWKPALVQAGVIPPPRKDPRQRSRFATSRREGLHQLRHYYASVMPAGGVSVKELAEYLGHADPGLRMPSTPESA